MPPDETQLLYSMCLHGRAELGLAPDEYAALTMVLLRLLAFKSPQQHSAEAEKKSLKTASPELAFQSPGPAQALSPPLLKVDESSSPATRQQQPDPATPTAIRPSVEPTPALAVDPLPPGRQVPVRDVSPTPSRPDSLRPAAAGGGAVPVRDLGPAVDRLDKPQASTEVVLVTTEEGDFWHALVQQMVAAERITALVRELALQSQLVGRDTHEWLLRIERET
jgi:DNA polymerase-3 subunit gamma/tau